MIGSMQRKGGFVESSDMIIRPASHRKETPTCSKGPRPRPGLPR